VIRVEKSIVIDRSSDDVFAYVADQTNAVRWQSGIAEIRRLTDGPPGVGTRHVFVRTLMGKRLTGENEYIAWEPGRRVTFRTTSGPGLLASYIVDSTAGGARLTTTMELDVSGLMSLAEPLVAVGLRRDVDANLGRLKRILEAPALVTASDDAVVEGL
jgi:hypothetical protein